MLERQYMELIFSDLYYLLLKGFHNKSLLLVKFRNSSRFLVRKMEFWIQPVSGHYSAIPPYPKPFFPPDLCSQPWLITALHNVALKGTPVDKIDNEVSQTE